MKGSSYVWICCAFCATSVLASEARAQAPPYTRYSIPELFSYEELLVLSEDKEFPPELARKLEANYHHPFLEQ